MSLGILWHWFNGFLIWLPVILLFKARFRVNIISSKLPANAQGWTNFIYFYFVLPFIIVFKSNETPNWCNTVQVLFLQGHSTCFGRKRPSSGLFKTSTAVTGTCVIVVGKSSHLLIRAGRTTYQSDLTTFLQPRHIPTRGYNITQSSAPDDGHMVARNMLRNY